MSLGVGLFYAFAAFTVLSAAGVAFSPNIVYSAFALLGTLFGVAALYVFLAADFVAAAHFLIYIGGVLVLILFAVMLTTLKVSSMVFVILLGASVFSLTFRGLGGERIVSDTLNAMPGGAFGAMFVVMALMFVLGFFLDFIEIVFVVVPIVGPILLAMGIDPIWLGVMIAVNLQTSFLTPPFGFALFYLRGVAPPSITTMDIYRGIIPFVMIQVLALFILAMAPELATWLPKALFG